MRAVANNILALRRIAGSALGGSNVAEAVGPAIVTHAESESPAAGAAEPPPTVGSEEPSLDELPATTQIAAEGALAVEAAAATVAVQRESSGGEPAPTHDREAGLGDSNADEEDEDSALAALGF